MKVLVYRYIGIWYVRHGILVPKWSNLGTLTHESWCLGTLTHEALYFGTKMVDFSGGHGILVPKWSILVVWGNETEPRVRGQMASRAKIS